MDAIAMNSHLKATRAKPKHVSKAVSLSLRDPALPWTEAYVVMGPVANKCRLLWAKVQKYLLVQTSYRCQSYYDSESECNRQAADAFLPA